MKKRTLCLISLLLMVITISSLIYAQGPTVFGPKEFTISWLGIHVSLNRFAIDDPGDGVITITKNTPELKLKGGFVLCNRSMIQLREFFRGTDRNFEKEISLRATNRLMVLLWGQRKASMRLEVRKENPIDPPEVAFSVDPSAITLGESSTLTWTTTNADSASIDHGIGSVDLSGSMDVSPTETTTYTLTAEGKGGITSKDVTVLVHPPPTVAISADPQTITVGDSATLIWNSTSADSCTIEPDPGFVSANGFSLVSPSDTTTYSITGTGPGGTATATVTVTVILPTPTVSISADPTTIPLGDTSLLAWDSTNAETVTIDQGIGVVPLSGFLNVSPAQTTTYTITAAGPGGTDTASAQVMVITPPEDVDYGHPDDEQQGGGGHVGKRICILNGNTVEGRSDLSFPSPHRLGLVFEAYYNSKSYTLGPLGTGWTHTYGATLDPAFLMGDRVFLRIVDDTGRAAYFKEQTSGVYEGIFKERTYVTVEGEGYIWYRLDGSSYAFSDEGKLIWIADPAGNSLELSYNGQDGLETVTDMASGRMLAYNYNDEGLLSSITGPITEAVPDGIWVTYGYDANQNLITVTYADGSGVSYFYEDSLDMHNLTEKQNAMSHLLATWVYDDEDRCVENFCSRGKGVSITYGDDAQVEVTDAHGTRRKYGIAEIHGRKRVVSLEGPAWASYSDNTIIRWAYDDTMNLVETETAGGTIYQYQDCDERGNPHTIRLAVGTPEERVITFIYHPTMNVPLTRAEPSVLTTGTKLTTWDYDDDGDAIPNEDPTALLSRIIEAGYTRTLSDTIVPYEYSTTFTYTDKGQLQSVDGPLPGSDDTISFTYHAKTRDLLAITRPLIGDTTFTDYNPAGQIGRLTDVNGQSDSFSYDAKGRITTLTHEADGSSTTTTYNTAGTAASSSDEDDVTYTYDYDPHYGRLIRITDRDENYISYAYDPQGNRVELSKHDPADTRTYLKRWTYEYPDLPGKLWREINADDTFTEYSYDAEGNIASVKDPNGFSTYYAYDPHNRLASVTQPGSVITTCTYDTHGNLTSVADANGNLSRYQYDDMGRLVSITSTDTGTTTYTYDAASNLLTKTDAKGITAEYTYDPLNRLTGIHFPDPRDDITCSYDAGAYGKGRRTGMIDPSGETTYTYDARGRLVQKATTILGQTYRIATIYCPGSRMMSITYPSGRTLGYTRDSTGRMEGLSTTFNTNTTPLVSNMTYNPFASPTGLSTGSGGAVNNHSGESGILEVANPGEQMERIYTCDNNRNLMDVYSPNVPWYNQSFTYDELNRLTNAEGRYGIISYTYDAVGNRLTRSVNDDTEDYTYLTGTNKLDSITGTNPVSFAYDANGNATTIGTKTLIYNQNNRLIRLEENSLVLGEYTYNGLGQRVTKTVDGTTTIFHYDHTGKLIAESLPDGTVTAEYLYMGKIRIAKVDVTTGSIYYYLNDRLGTPQIMTDDTGTIVWEASYKPFGEATINPRSSVVNNFRFPGQYFDEETGLHYNYFRYYDPRTGRYLRPDPMGLTGGMNVFVYARDNPVNSTDRFGLLGLFGGASFRVTGPGVSGVGTIRVIVGSEGDKLEGMLLGGGSGTFAAGGFAAGRGPEVGFFLGKASDFLKTIAMDIDTPIGGLTIFIDKQGKFAGLGLGGPSMIFGIGATGPSLPSFSYYPLDMELFSIDFDPKIDLNICEN